MNFAELVHGRNLSVVPHSFTFVFLSLPITFVNADLGLHKVAPLNLYTIFSAFCKPCQFHSFLYDILRS